MRLRQFTSHHRLATPDSPWERLKIGCGTPPILTRHGWLILYHGVSESQENSVAAHQLCYSAGVMVLSQKHPRVIRYRSAEPVLTPVLPQERHGTLPMLCSPPASTAATILVRPTVSTSIMGWPTTGLARHASTFRNTCRSASTLTLTPLKRWSRKLVIPIENDTPFLAQL